MWLVDHLWGTYTYRSGWSFEALDYQIVNGVNWPLCPEGKGLVMQWMNTNPVEDAAISGVLADWLDDHRDSLLDGAVGPDPKGRLDLLIRWLREVRCWGNESVSA